eukprot:gene11584-13519_t
MSNCQQCDCRSFQANPFKPQYCSICLHQHNKKTSSLQQLVQNDQSGANRQTSTSPPPPPKPNALAKSNSTSNLKNYSGSSTPTSSVSSKPPSLPNKPSPQRNTPASTSTSTLPPARPKAQDFSKPATNTSVLPTPKPQSKSVGKSSGSSLKSRFAGWKDAISDKMSNMMDRDTESKEDDVIMEISGPTDYKHNTHIGITSTGAIETNNIPDEWKDIFKSVDAALKSLGRKGITRKEAALILNSVLSGQSPAQATSLRSQSPAGPPLPPKPKTAAPSLTKNTPATTSGVNLTKTTTPAYQEPVIVKPTAVAATNTSPAYSFTPYNNNNNTSEKSTPINRSPTIVSPTIQSPTIVSTPSGVSAFEHEQLAEKLRASENRNKNVEQLLKNAEKELGTLATKAKALETTNQILTSDKKSLETDYTQLKQSLSETEKNRRTVESDKRPLLDRIAQLEAKLKDFEMLEKRIRQLGNMLKEQEQSNFDLDLQNKEVTTQLDSLKGTLSVDQANQVKELTNQFASKEREIREAFEKQYSQKMKNLKEETDTLSTKLAAESSRASKLEMEVNSKAREIVTVAKQRDDALKQYDSAILSSEQMVVDLESAKSTIKTLKSTQNTSQSILDSNNKANEELNTQIRTQANTVSKLTSQLEEQTSSLEKYKSEVASLRNQLTQAQQQAAQSQQQAAQSQQQLAQSQQQLATEKNRVVAAAPAAVQVAAPPAPPPPPMAPAPPPPPPVGSIKTSAPAGDSSRMALLDAIKKPAQLKTVSEDMLAKPEAVQDDPNNMVNILVRALIDRPVVKDIKQSTDRLGSETCNNPGLLNKQLDNCSYGNRAIDLSVWRTYANVDRLIEHSLHHH